MKEMPGAPELPEGWCYRVTSEPYGRTARRYYVQVRRPFLWGTVPWGRAVVSNYLLGRAYDFYTSRETPSVDELARAAKIAYGGSDPDSIEGDYR